MTNDKNLPEWMLGLGAGEMRERNQGLKRELELQKAEEARIKHEQVQAFIKKAEIHGPAAQEMATKIIKDFLGLVEGKIKPIPVLGHDVKTDKNGWLLSGSYTSGWDGYLPGENGCFLTSDGVLRFFRVADQYAKVVQGPLIWDPSLSNWKSLGRPRLVSSWLQSGLYHCDQCAPGQPRIDLRDEVPKDPHESLLSNIVLRYCAGRDLL